MLYDKLELKFPKLNYGLELEFDKLKFQKEST